MRSRPCPRTRVRRPGRSGGAGKVQIPRRGRAVSGRRYYCPSQGRFLGRDPKMEKGGLNLYGFVTNNPINRWDYLGMEPDHTPTNAGETATVLEEIGPDPVTGITRYRYVTYRAVRLADMNNQENGSADNDLIWVVDETGNRDGPPRGMPENGGAPVASAGSGSVSVSVPIRTPSTPTVSVLTLQFGFDPTAFADTATIQSIRDGVAALQGLLSAAGHNVRIDQQFDYSRTGKTSPAGGNYDFGPDSSGAWVNPTATANLTGISGTGAGIKILLTGSTISALGDAAGAIQSGGSVVARTSVLGGNRYVLAHELGHVGGYAGGDSIGGIHMSTTNHIMNTHSPGSITDQAFIDAIMSLTVSMPVR
jgi:RHS repeat-associated protein